MYVTFYEFSHIMYRNSPTQYSERLLKNSFKLYHDAAMQLQ